MLDQWTHCGLASAHGIQVREMVLGFYCEKSGNDGDFLGPVIGSTSLNKWSWDKEPRDNVIAGRLTLYPDEMWNPWKGKWITLIENVKIKKQELSTLRLRLTGLTVWSWLTVPPWMTKEQTIWGAFLIFVVFSAIQRCYVYVTPLWGGLDWFNMTSNNPNCRDPMREDISCSKAILLKKKKKVALKWRFDNQVRTWQ